MRDKCRTFTVFVTHEGQTLHPAKAAATLGITQAFTSYNNPQGNSDTKRLMRTLKEELPWPRAWTSRIP